MRFQVSAWSGLGQIACRQIGITKRAQDGHEHSVLFFT